MWNIGHTWAVVGRAALSEANKSFSVSASQCPPNSFEAFLLNADFKMTSCHLNWLLSKDSNEVMAGDEAQPQVLSFQASSCHLLVSSVTAAFAVGSCRGEDALRKRWTLSWSFLAQQNECQHQVLWTLQLFMGREGLCLGGLPEGRSQQFGWGCRTS